MGKLAAGQRPKGIKKPKLRTKCSPPWSVKWEDEKCPEIRLSKSTGACRAGLGLGTTTGDRPSEGEVTGSQTLPSDPRQRFLPAARSSTPSPPTFPPPPTHTSQQQEVRKGAEGGTGGRGEQPGERHMQSGGSKETKPDSSLGWGYPPPQTRCHLLCPKALSLASGRNSRAGPRARVVVEGRQRCRACRRSFWAMISVSLEQGGCLERWAEEQADGEWSLWRGSQGAWPLWPETCGSEILLPPWPWAQPGQQEGQVGGVVMAPGQIILAPSTVWRNRCPRKAPSHFVPWRALSDQ